jgi:hypothetical protein
LSEAAAIKPSSRLKGRTADRTRTPTICGDAASNASNIDRGT